MTAHSMGTHGSMCHTYGPWERPYKVTRVLCADGRERVAYVRDADTFFTMPARVKVRGRTVTGHIWIDTVPDSPTEGHVLFVPFAYRKNANALPAWREATA